MELIARMVMGVSENPITQGPVLVDSKDWAAVIAVHENGNGNGNGETFVCPYSCGEFDTYEEWLAHMRGVHGFEPPPEGEDLLKYALIGGGVILGAVAIRQVAKREKK